jgi:predicted lipid-binding transport protein (Tim44 family)
MARNGYSSPDPNTLALQQEAGLGLRASASGPNSPPGSAPTAAQNAAQIALAVADAGCTLSTDLAGIYFAVQASYEQQFVTANQQALNVAVREYKANYAKELAKLPALLRTMSATPGLPHGPGTSRNSHPGKPSPR